MAGLNQTQWWLSYSTRERDFFPQEYIFCHNDLLSFTLQSISELFLTTSNVFQPAKCHRSGIKEFGQGAGSIISGSSAEICRIHITCCVILYQNINSCAYTVFLERIFSLLSRQCPLETQRPPVKEMPWSFVPKLLQRKVSEVTIDILRSRGSGQA